jgi:hypothetical protein
MRRVKQPRAGVDVLPVKRIVLVVLGFAALAAIAAVAYVRGALPGTDGCVLRSVDKAKYVAGNDAVFRSIRLPRWLREARANTWVHGVSARNSCLPIEDTGGRPYGAYTTTYVFLQKPGGRPIGFDARILRGQWVRQPNTYTVFRRGLASLTVSTTSEGVLLSIDYRRYARSGE